jgi:hypothetical protein
MSLLPVFRSANGLRVIVVKTFSACTSPTFLNQYCIGPELQLPAVGLQRITPNNCGGFVNCTTGR